VDKPAIKELRRNRCLLWDWIEAGEVVPLIEVLLEPRLGRGRFPVMNAVPNLGDTRFVPALVQLLSDDDFGIRGRAAQTLSYCALKGMPVEEAVPALLRCTEDDDEYVRMNALIALSQIGEQSVVPAFLELAERSPVANYRTTAVAALGRLRAPEAETYFIRYLDDREEADWAATWLEEIGTDASLRPLRKAAKRDPAHSNDYNKAIAAIEGRKGNAAA
jgi:hypothetical protein